jgi:hypothetical protein
LWLLLSSLWALGLALVLGAQVPALFGDATVLAVGLILLALSLWIGPMTAACGVVFALTGHRLSPLDDKAIARFQRVAPRCALAVTGLTALVATLRLLRAYDGDVLTTAYSEVFVFRTLLTGAWVTALLAIVLPGPIAGPATAGPIAPFWKRRLGIAGLVLMLLFAFALLGAIPIAPFIPPLDLLGVLGLVACWAIAGVGRTGIRALWSGTLAESHTGWNEAVTIWVTSATQVIGVLVLFHALSSLWRPEMLRTGIVAFGAVQLYGLGLAALLRSPRHALGRAGPGLMLFSLPAGIAGGALGILIFSLCSRPAADFSLEGKSPSCTGRELRYCHETVGWLMENDTLQYTYDQDPRLEPVFRNACIQGEALACGILALRGGTCHGNGARSPFCQPWVFRDLNEKCGKDDRYACLAAAQLGERYGDENPSFRFPPGGLDAPRLLIRACDLGSRPACDSVARLTPVDFRRPGGPSLPGFLGHYDVFEKLACFFPAAGHCPPDNENWVESDLRGACRSGTIAACRMLTRAYESGYLTVGGKYFTIAESAPLALKFLEQACSLGDVTACEKRVLDSRDTAVPRASDRAVASRPEQDPVNVSNWIEAMTRSCAQGWAYECRRLGELYGHRIDRVAPPHEILDSPERQRERAERFYARGCELGDRYACRGAAETAFESDPAATRIAHFRELGCNLWDVASCLELVRAYRFGKFGLKASPEKVRVLEAQAIKYGAEPDDIAEAGKNEELD